MWWAHIEAMAALHATDGKNPASTSRRGKRTRCGERRSTGSAGGQCVRETRHGRHHSGSLRRLAGHGVGQHLVQRHGAAGEITHGLHALRRHPVGTPLRHGGLSQAEVRSQRRESAAVGIEPIGEIHDLYFSGRES